MRFLEALTLGVLIVSSTAVLAQNSVSKKAASCPAPSVKSDEAQNPRAIAFREAIRANKNAIMALYPDSQLTSQQYEELANLSFALTAPESRYGLSGWYVLKSLTPEFGQRLARKYWRPKVAWATPLSSGPSQIKFIPTLAAQKFKVTPASLYANPKHAGITTIMYLIELRDQLLDRKARAPQDLPFLNSRTLLDHMVYFYQNKGGRVLRGERPHPDNNCYLRLVRQQMTELDLLPRPEVLVGDADVPAQSVN